MRYAAMLLLCSFCFAQTKPIKSKALTKCETQLNSAATDAQNYRDAFVGTNEDNAALRDRVKELEAKNAELSKKVEDINVAGREVIAYTQRLETEYRSLTIVYDAMVRELNRSTDQIEQKNAQIAERNTRAMERIAASQEQNARINRAMALFSVLKPAPVQTPMPILTPPRPQVNCTSSTLGNTTYTDCH